MTDELPERPPNVEVSTVPRWVDRLPWRRRARERAALDARLAQQERLMSSVVAALGGHTTTMRQQAMGWLDMAARIGAVELMIANSGKKKRAIMQRLYQRILVDLQAQANEQTATPERVRAAVEAHLDAAEPAAEPAAEEQHADGTA